MSFHIFGSHPEEVLRLFWDVYYLKGSGTGWIFMDGVGRDPPSLYGYLVGSLDFNFLGDRTFSIHLQSRGSGLLGLFWGFEGFLSKSKPFHTLTEFLDLILCGKTILVANTKFRLFGQFTQEVSRVDSIWNRV